MNDTLASSWNAYCDQQVVQTSLILECHEIISGLFSKLQRVSTSNIRRIKRGAYHPSRILRLTAARPFLQSPPLYN